MATRTARVVAVATAAIVLVLVVGCGARSAKNTDPPAQQSAATTTAPDGRPAGSSPLPTSHSPRKPNPCALLSHQMADSLAGVEVRSFSAQPAYYGPNIVCEYATTTGNASSSVLVSLVATVLQTNGHSYTAQDWSDLVHALNRYRFPIAIVSTLSSEKYYGWSVGPSTIKGSRDTTVYGDCGFASHGYSFDLGGQWRGTRAPSQSEIVATCEKIAAKI